MQGHTGHLVQKPVDLYAASPSFAPTDAPPLQPFVDKQFQKYVHGKEKKPPQVGV